MTANDASANGGDTRRPVVYCVIPRELAAKLHDPLRRHFRDDPKVEVVVESRRRERRLGSERRGIEKTPPRGVERRRIRAIAGRRVAERRAALIPLDKRPELARPARRYAERIAFVERLEPSRQRAEDDDTARLVMRFQLGDEETFATLYTRYFDRVYGYLRVIFRDPSEAEDATAEAFTQVFEALPAYERRRQPFRAWLFVIVRRLAITRLRKLSKVELVDPDGLDRQRERDGSAPADLDSLGWLSDPDLILFVERLPLAQRQVLILRFMLDMDARQVGEVLGRSTDDVRMLQHRAIRFLEARLTAVGRKPEHRGHPIRVQRVRRQSGILRLRRFVLT